ncbi:EF-hand domain-containing protein [Methylocucumis oryzae]|uniref:EF-hand domain-containing protein n=1 Tax=Methylocucumis oryzae TaxID=1632867 RepID=A0A0F3IH21_9GAMM|nr:EF-hand domain-containing protein [Methylocucumis oryzae]KJV06007.1 hypothetical protein VZ94_14240 [Methylocucumis oryzae]
MNINTSNSLASSALYNAYSKPNASQLAETAFNKLDSKGQGFIEKSDLQAAYDKLSNNNGSQQTNVDDVFNTLDSDSNGQVSKTEFTASVEKIASDLDGPAPRLRLQSTDATSETSNGSPASGGPQGLPPPPPPSTNADSSNSSQSFDPADTNQDGVVTQAETSAYQQTQQNNASSQDEQVKKQIFQLAQAYGESGRDSSFQGLSVSA